MQRDLCPVKGIESILATHSIHSLPELFNIFCASDSTFVLCEQKKIIIHPFLIYQSAIKMIIIIPKKKTSDGWQKWHKPPSIISDQTKPLPSILIDFVSNMSTPWETRRVELSREEWNSRIHKNQSRKMLGKLKSSVTIEKWWRRRQSKANPVPATNTHTHTQP